MARGRAPDFTDVAGGVEALLRDPRVIWLPVKHYSPACAWHVGRVIRHRRPAAVLVEGPDDATALIPHIVDAETEPPLTILSTYSDARNIYGQNGVLSAAVDVPARYRSWWPMTAYAPEYAALRAGLEVGAALRFIDLSLTARIPTRHSRRARDTEVVEDGRLATSAYFEALRRKDRRRSFSEFWEARFEAGAFDLDADRFFRAVLTFAWCARYAASDDPNLEADGTHLREGHMRWHLDRALAEAGERPVAVVTGAFHTVALPFCRPKRVSARRDARLETLVTAHSFPALARLYAMERLPGFTQAVWDAAHDSPARPADRAAMGLLVEIMRAGREAKLPLSTADAVGAWQAAQNLARLRGNPQVTVFDLLDATQMSYVKGERRLMGGPLLQVARGVLVGRRQGRITAAAGEVPLRADFYAEARRHRIDVSGAHKVVLIKLHTQKGHRAKSAFLHRCEALGLPIFAALDAGRRRGQHFRGPDPLTGEDLHLITETWGVRWREAVDDRLVEQSALGTTVAQAAGEQLRAALPAARQDATAAARLLLRCARMALVDHFDVVLDVFEEAVQADGAFLHLVDALTDCVLMQGYRDAMATHGHARLLETVQHLFRRAAITLPSIAGTEPARHKAVLDRLATLVRISLSFEAAPLDRELLLTQVQVLAAAPEARPGVRGAAFGVLYTFGIARAEAIAAELLSCVRGSPAHRMEAGGFLDGLFTNARGILLHTPQLLVAINRVLGELDWLTFKSLLPDLRRAFTQFLPAELEAIAGRVGRTLGLTPIVAPPAAPSEALQRVGGAIDARIEAALAPWII